VPISSREVIRRLEAAGWRLARVAGSHHHFKHPRKPGLVTIAHPQRDVKIGTLRSIERQSGVRLRKE
jgi:predicted RNA binding protein YcfA (HicA-like mRNA interferase family)